MNRLQSGLAADDHDESNSAVPQPAGPDSLKTINSMAPRDERGDGGTAPAETSRSPAKGDEEEDLCGVCCNPLPDVERGTTVCGHVFCFACVHSWVGEKATCPTCNHPVTKLFKTLSPEDLAKEEARKLRNNNKRKKYPTKRQALLCKRKAARVRNPTEGVFSKAIRLRKKKRTPTPTQEGVGEHQQDEQIARPAMPVEKSRPHEGFPYTFGRLSEAGRRAIEKRLADGERIRQKRLRAQKRRSLAKKAKRRAAEAVAKAAQQVRLAAAQRECGDAPDRAVTSSTGDDVVREQEMHLTLAGSLDVGAASTAPGHHRGMIIPNFEAMIRDGARERARGRDRDRATRLDPTKDDGEDGRERQRELKRERQIEAQRQREQREEHLQQGELDQTQEVLTRQGMDQARQEAMQSSTAEQSSIRSSAVAQASAAVDAAPNELHAEELNARPAEELVALETNGRGGGTSGGGGGGPIFDSTLSPDTAR